MSQQRTMPFGKHKGMSIDRIAEIDLDYLDWLKNKRIDKVTGQHIPLTGWLGEEVDRCLREAGAAPADPPPLSQPSFDLGASKQETPWG